VFLTNAEDAAGRVELGIGIKQPRRTFLTARFSLSRARAATMQESAALRISWAVSQVINPAIKARYPTTLFTLSHVIGVDASRLYVSRVGVHGDNDLVWIGRAANYTAKLCSAKAREITAPTVYMVDDDDGMRRALNTPLITAGDKTIVCCGPKISWRTLTRMREGASCSIFACRK
jgi:class 3 adenylate cyclase